MLTQVAVFDMLTPVAVFDMLTVSINNGGF